MNSLRLESADLPGIHPEHLNTPRMVADSSQKTVWKWDQQEPFGNNPANEDPNSLGAFDLPLRLPGQRYDSETALHYNYFRDYDPSLGRYVESDLVGLRGGLNTYAYSSDNPISRSDLLGLLTRLCSRPLAGWPFQIGPFRHDFIDLNGTDWGYYCVGAGCPLIGQGQVRPNVEARPFQNCMEWDCINESTLIANILASQSNPPNYRLACANCQNWALEMLTKAFDSSKCTHCRKSPDSH